MKRRLHHCALNHSCARFSPRPSKLPTFSTTCLAQTHQGITHEISKIMPFSAFFLGAGDSKGDRKGRESHLKDLPAPPLADELQLASLQEPLHCAGKVPALHHPRKLNTLCVLCACTTGLQSVHVSRTCHKTKEDDKLNDTLSKGC